MHRNTIQMLVGILVLAIVTAGAAELAMLQGSAGPVLKVVGIGAVVKKFGPQINTFINKLMRDNNAENKEMTKVVPIVSVSIGINTSGSAAIGAAQVQGPQAALDKVQAVAQIEGTFSDQVRVKALIPVDSQPDQGQDSPDLWGGADCPRGYQNLIRSARSRLVGSSQRRYFSNEVPILIECAV